MKKRLYIPLFITVLFGACQKNAKYIEPVANTATAEIATAEDASLTFNPALQLVVYQLSVVAVPAQIRCGGSERHKQRNAVPEYGMEQLETRR